MPIPTETLWNTRRLNVIFAIVAAAMLGSLGWMLWHDYNRSWRHTQTAYFNLHSALAHFTALAYDSPEEQAKHAALKAALAEAQAELNKPEIKARLDELKREEKELAGRLQGAALAFGNRNAKLGVTVFDYEEAKAIHGPEHPITIAMKAKYDAELAELAELKARKEDIENQLHSKRQELKKYDAKRKAAAKALAAYEKGLNDAVKQASSFGPGPVRSIINFPILDYAAPKGTPGRQEIRQVFMPDVRFNYNFTDSYVTDRCITCHVAIDEPTLTVDNFVKQTEAAIHTRRVSDIIRNADEALVQTLAKRIAAEDASDFPPDLLAKPADASTEAGQRQQQARRRFVDVFVKVANNYLHEIKRPSISVEQIWETLSDSPLDRGIVASRIESAFRAILVAAPPKDADGKKLTYDEMDPQQKKAYFTSLTAAMNLYLSREGRPEVSLDAVLAAHPRLDLFVSQKSPHSMKKIGCTVCHEGSGQDTDFVLAAHTPKNEEEKELWTKKYYVREAGLPLSTFHTIEEYWEHPMLLPRYVSASCAKCHTDIYDLERYNTDTLAEAGNVVEGRDLFTKIGCINCHNVDGLSDSRRVGPDLLHVDDKLSAGFMEHWIEYPNDFRPSTRMPHFFHQENNLPSSANEEFDPDPVLRTKTEIKAITRYLRTFSLAFDALPLPEGIQGDAARGEKLFVSIGCMACHVNLDAHDPRDQAGRTFAREWIVEDLVFEAAKAEAEKRIAQGKPADPETVQGFMDQARDAARASFEKMSKNDRARYAMRRFTPQRRKEARRVSKAEIFNADIEGRDPDPLKLYVPPAFTRHAPELSGMGTKLVNDPGDPQQVVHGKNWLYNWLRDPRHYSSETVMPRLFRDNYYQGLPVKERRLKNDQDILDITEFLLSLRNDDFDTTQSAETPEQDAEMQRLILMILGGQNTASVAKKILDDAKTDPSDPYGPLTRAIVAQTYRSFGGGKEGRQRAAALINARSPSLRDRQQLFLGMKMITHYGCYSCHNIRGFEDATRIGTDLTLWGQKFMSQLDFAFYSPVFDEERKAEPEIWADLYPNTPETAHLIRDIRVKAEDLITGRGGNVPQEILHNHAAFAYHKLRNPRIYDREKFKKPYEKLKMPNFFLTEGEATALTTFLLSRRDPDVREAVKIKYKDTPIGRISRGRALVRQLNCIGCHTIEGGSEATIQQFYSDDPSAESDSLFGIRYRPPLLWGEGAKIQYDWLFSFLNNVEMLRPWLHVRMPSFHLTTDQATTLVEYFAGLSQDQADLLGDELAPVVKYLQQVHAGGGASGSDANWFTEKKFTDTADFLKRYALIHEQVRPYAFDDSAATTPGERAEALAPGFKKVLERSEFLASLFDVAFPYSDPLTHTIDDNRFQKGEALFFDQKCLACHVAGDPTVPGTTTDIKAPNFALAYKRLRYEWVINWLQDPQAIQPGANMPQIFQGGSAYASLPEDVRVAKEAQFGKTAHEQASLLVDYLFALGRRRHTAIQPGALEKQSEAKPAQDTDFDFDEDSDSDDKQEEPDFDFDG